MKNEKMMEEKSLEEGFINEKHNNNKQQRVSSKRRKKKKKRRRRQGERMRPLYIEQQKILKNGKTLLSSSWSRWFPAFTDIAFLKDRKEILNYSRCNAGCHSMSLGKHQRREKQQQVVPAERRPSWPQSKFQLNLNQNSNFTSTMIMDEVVFKRKISQFPGSFSCRAAQLKFHQHMRDKSLHLASYLFLIFALVAVCGKTASCESLKAARLAATLDTQEQQWQLSLTSHDLSLSESDEGNKQEQERRTNWIGKASEERELSMRMKENPVVEEKFQQQQQLSSSSLTQIPATAPQEQSQKQQQEQKQNEQRQITSLSNVTAQAHRTKRSASPGTMQLQDSRRKHNPSMKLANRDQHPESSSPTKGAANGGQTVSGTPVVYAMLRGQVVLTCDLEPSEPDDVVSLVLWYKDSSMVPIYSVDARSAPIHEARHKPGPWLEGRSSLIISGSPAPSRNRRSTRRTNLTFSENDSNSRAITVRQQRHSHRWRHPQFRSGGWTVFGDKNLLRQPLALHSEREQTLALASASASAQHPKAESAQTAKTKRLIAQLRIDSLSSEDNGIYLCRVDFRKARSRTNETELRIIVPPDKPRIREFSGASRQQLEGSAEQPVSVSGEEFTITQFGPYQEGTPLTLECETQGGFPEPQLTWWRDGRLVDDSYEVLSASDGSILAYHQSRFGSEAPDADTFRQQAGLVGGGSSELESELRLRAADRESSTLTSGNSQLELPEQERDVLSQLHPAAALAPTTNRLIRNRLELSALTRADLMANYSCQAWNTKLSEPPATSAMIDMNLRPVKVQIENERAPVIADRPLEILCRAFGSRPAARISWWRNGQRVGLGSSSGSSEDERASRATTGGVRVHDEQTTATAELDSMLNASLSTLALVPRPEDSGQMISCRAENPLALGSGAQNELVAPSSGTLGHQFIEDFWKLEVHYLPRVSLALGEKFRLSGSTIREGHDVYLECSVLAQPTAHEIRWWFEGRELETNRSAGVIISNQSLVLQRVSRQQRGRYTCSAVNSLGEAHSPPLQLRVQFAPVCRGSSAHSTERMGTLANDDRDEESAARVSLVRTQYGAARMEPVRVRCHVDADPAEQLSFRWAFVAAAGQSSSSIAAGVANEKSTRQSAASSSAQQFSGQQLVFLEPEMLTSGESDPLVGVASYTPRTELDYGTLLCWAKNSLGEQTEPCAYQVVPAERPDPVRNCHLVNASDIQLTVACEPGYDGGNQQSLQMEVYESARRELVANVSISQPTASNWELPGPEQPASLVSSSSSSAASANTHPHLQRQRHSNSISNNNNADVLVIQQDEAPTRIYEAILATEPNLRPGTDYFLSIYATNVKGSSQPVALTAATTASGFLSPSSSSASETFAGREGRKADSSHLLSDVLALSWNPFLVICAISVVLFIMFTSITLAIIKYVDFSVGTSHSHRSTGSPSNSCSAPACSLADSILQQSSTGGAKSSGGSPQSDQNHHDSELQRGSSSSSSCTLRGRRGQRARVIALAAPTPGGYANASQTDGTGSGSFHKQRSSTLGNPYLSFKVQQFTGEQQETLYSSNGNAEMMLMLRRHSNSDHFLNQHDEFGQQSVSHTMCGTLPKNCSSAMLANSHFANLQPLTHHLASGEQVAMRQVAHLEQQDEGKQFIQNVGSGGFSQVQRHLQLAQTGCVASNCSPSDNLSQQQLVCMNRLGQTELIIDGRLSNYTTSGETQQQLPDKWNARAGFSPSNLLATHKDLSSGLTSAKGIYASTTPNSCEDSARQIDQTGYLLESRATPICHLNGDSSALRDEISAFEQQQHIEQNNNCENNHYNHHLANQVNATSSESATSNQLDSDGMSSNGTQTRTATTGSPSSGVADLDHHHNHNHYHSHSHYNSNQISQYQTRIVQNSNSSTITSDLHHQQENQIGNVISASQAQQPSPTDIRILSSNSALKRSTNVGSLATLKQSSKRSQEYNSQDQYTIYVDSLPENMTKQLNNQSNKFYLLQQDQNNSKACLRVISHSTTPSDPSNPTKPSLVAVNNQEQQQQQQQQQQINATLLPQTDTNNNPTNNNAFNDLHTDV